MMYNELVKTVFTGSIYNSIQIKDYFPLQIRSNHGIGIIASMFGMKTKIFNDMLPYVIPIQDKEEIKKIVKRGIPDFKKGLGKGVYDTHQFYHEKLKQYPKCARGIKITHPDMQGPFDIAHQIIGFDIFLMLYDERNLIHELLELITQTYIQYRKFIEDHYHLNDKADKEMIYIHGDICYGKVVIKDDTPQVSLSPTMYEEFSWQYNEKIFDEFKGTYHCWMNLKEPIIVAAESMTISINFWIKIRMSKESIMAIRKTIISKISIKKIKAKKEPFIPGDGIKIILI